MAIYRGSGGAGDANNTVSVNEIEQFANAANFSKQYAEEWATKAEDSLVSTEAGGDGSTDYSSLHHSAKASIAQTASEVAQAAAEAAQALAETAETNASNSASNASTSEANALASEIAAAASAATVPAYDTITGKALNFVRLNVGETSMEFRTPAEVLSDIGAEPADATILKDADIGVTVQAYDATLEVGATADQIASEVPNSPAGNISATDVQAAINELDTLMPRKNYIINGDMRISQRGDTAAVLSTYVYGGADRMLTSVNSLTSGTIRQLTAGVSTGVSGYSHSVQCTTSAANSVLFQTRLEGNDTKQLNGKTVTFSAKVYHDTGAAINITTKIIKPTTTLDTFSATTDLASDTVSAPNATLTEVTLTYTLGATEASLGLGVQLEFQTTSAVTSKYFTITDLQLEKGSVATDFEYRPIGEELTLCQRYYRDDFYGTGEWTTTTNSYIFSGLNPPMRVAPTIGTPSGNIGEIGIADRTVSGVVSNGLGEAGGFILFTTAAATVGNMSGSTSSLVVPLSAEL